MNQDLSFYPYLTQQQKELLDRSTQTVAAPKGQIVHRHGDACVGIIYVEKGRLNFSVLSEEGREITLFRAGPGESCVLSAACVLQGFDLESQVITEVNSQLRILPAPILSQLMNENPEVERLVYKRAVIQYSGALRTIQRIVFFSLEKRLALFLREETVRRDAAIYRGTHEQIARCIGSSREVVTRMLNQFADRGIVALGRGSVTVLDPEGLEDMAE